jgi:hypothetical protein
MVVRPSGSEIEVREDDWNAPWPILVTPCGMTIDVIDEPVKADSPIDVTV